jgi:cellulose synthase (UDP-forming)
VIRGRLRVEYLLLVGLWLAANLLLWSWWFRPANMGAPVLFGLVSAAIFYDFTFLPGLYMFFVGRMRRPVSVSSPPGMRVAVVTLCVPSKESPEVIERQLRAMAGLAVPAGCTVDRWVLDEENNLFVRRRAAEYGIRHFSRRGIAKYNQPGPPFQAKTKAGNFNSWFDAVGRDYDVYVLLDIDHNPRPFYLDRVLGYFQDPEIGWIAAPSLYGNLDRWTARGAMEQELPFQVPMQAGFYGWSGAPFIIGSHYAVRREALESVGLLPPTRAEDHLVTVAMAAKGWKGVFVPEALAVGDGPETLEVYLGQQFAWAYSIAQVLFSWTPKYIGRWTLPRVAQFLFAQTFYPLWSASMAILALAPAFALVSGLPIGHVSLWDFLVRSAPVQGATLAFWFWTRRWFLPQGLLLSWRGIVLQIARWPVTLWAVINAVAGIRHPYMITPKGAAARRPRTAGSPDTRPIYLALLATQLLAMAVFLVRQGPPDVQGYLLFAVETTVMVGLVLTIDLLGGWGQAGLGSARLQVGRVALLWAVVGTSAVLAGPLIGQALLPAGESRPASAVSAAGLPVRSLPQDRVAFGVYDPSGALLSLPQVSIEHIFWNWTLDPSGLAAQVKEIRSRGHVPMVSAEPWPRDDSVTLIQDVAAGKYDGEVRRMCSVLAAESPQEILLRWGHEMDLKGLYPWSGGPPADYVGAYRRVVDICRAAGASNVKFVWSPAGTPVARDYWPGQTDVDYVGLTVLGFREWDVFWGAPDALSFMEIFGPKFELVKGFGKPLIVAELGVAGEGKYRVEWLKAAFRAAQGIAELRALVYFNDVNPPNSAGLFKTPDWRISPELLREALLGVPGTRGSPAYGSRPW